MPQPETGFDASYLEVARRWQELSICASGIRATCIPLEPEPQDIEAIGDDLRLLAQRVDALVEAYGAYVDANAPGVDQATFKDTLFGALDGNALYEIERAAQRLHDELEEERAYARSSHSPR